MVHIYFHIYFFRRCPFLQGLRVGTLLGATTQHVQQTQQMQPTQQRRYVSVQQWLRCCACLVVALLHLLHRAMRGSVDLRVLQGPQIRQPFLATAVGCCARRPETHAAFELRNFVAERLRFFFLFRSGREGRQDVRRTFVQYLGAPDQERIAIRAPAVASQAPAGFREDL